MDTQEQVEKHSPLPWHGAAKDSTMVVAADRARVADCSVAIGMTREEMEANAVLIVKAVNERAELIAALRNLSNMTLLIMPPPYGHECGWCGGCVKRAKSEARALLDKVNKQ